VHNTHLPSRRNNSGGISENETKGVSHTLALPFTLKSILMQKKKKNYGKFKYFTIMSLKYNLQKKKKKKSFKRNQKSFKIS
jgi:hypothetical protein